MIDKQLNFLHIFDDALLKKSEDLKGDQKEINQQDDGDLDMLENDPLLFDEQERKNRQAAEEIFANQEAAEKETKRQAYIKSLRSNILRKEGSFSVNDFIYFSEELSAYNDRMQSFQAEHQAASTGEEKECLYRKLVSPHLEDEVAYRETALLYLRYLDALQAEKNKKIEELGNKKVLQKKVQVNPDVKTKGNKISNSFWQTPNPHAGKDAAAKEYLDLE